MVPIYFITLLLAILSFRFACSSASKPSGYKVTGVVLVPGGSRVSAANAIVHLFASDGQHITALCDNDGSFTLQDVPKGSHFMQAHLMQFYYPEIHVEVRARGAVTGYIATPGPNGKQNIQVIQEPLVMGSLGGLQYYEKRQPFDVLSIIKSPYGIMIVVSVFIIFIFPMMKVDPEEYKQFQDQIKGSSSTASGGQSQARIKSS